MPTPGILFRLIEPVDNTSPADLSLAPSNIGPEVEAVYKLTRNDKLTPSYNTVYFLSDLTPLLSNAEALYAKDKSTSGAGLKTLDWQIYALINGREKPGVAVVPPKDTVIVANGSTPRPDKEQDYHDWYDQEHGEKLSKVPGWRMARRYRFVKDFGSGEGVPSFLGTNYYDKENGLGGPEWQAGVTEWTLRIRSNAAKPNHRRVWSVESTS